MDAKEQPEPHVEEPPDEPRAAEPVSKPLTLKGSFGTAMGAAMLGFEQALRREPPAEILAAEHQPERGYAGQDGDLVIGFPDPTTVALPTAGEPEDQRRRRPERPNRGTSLNRK